MWPCVIICVSTHTHTHNPTQAETANIDVLSSPLVLSDTLKTDSPNNHRHHYPRCPAKPAMPWASCCCCCHCCYCAAAIACPLRRGRHDTTTTTTASHNVCFCMRSVSLFCVRACCLLARTTLRCRRRSSSFYGGSRRWFGSIFCRLSRAPRPGAVLSIQAFRVVGFSGIVGTVVGGWVGVWSGRTCAADVSLGRFARMFRITCRHTRFRQSDYWDNMLKHPTQRRTSSN